ncbi:Conserved hypothetical protein CHP02466 [uncultured Caudovirales phage]|uniref:Uncharacterized protein n=1 Tax=uncultured Caudovirales phage TaxID=2100421 RepID=A0A6J7WU83_9CAUD|nr:Conserved hypothetical protein CHP02466 [uncultured Caudovirales phage]
MIEKIYSVRATPIVVYKTTEKISGEEFVDILSMEYQEPHYDPVNDAENFHRISQDPFILEHPSLASIKDTCITYLNKYVKEVLNITDEFVITNSWIIRCPADSKHHLHTHPNSIFSAVYYIHADEQSSDMVFHYDTTYDTNYKFTYNCSEPNQYNSGKLTIKPKTGDFLIFPSYLKHNVTANKSQNERIILSFNSFLTGTVGTSQGKSYLNLDTKNAEH